MVLQVVGAHLYRMHCERQPECCACCVVLCFGSPRSCKTLLDDRHDLMPRGARLPAYLLSILEAHIIKTELAMSAMFMLKLTRACRIVSIFFMS